MSFLVACKPSSPVATLDSVPTGEQSSGTEATGASDDERLVAFQDKGNAKGKGIQLDAKRAFGYLKKICEIGSRTTGTEGMKKQQELLEKHFVSFGAKVDWQAFEHRNPQTGAKVEIKNMIVSWQPELQDRVLLCTHYDTKPYPSNDQRNPKGLFIGANDGASGPALFMELAHSLQNLKPAVGVDLVLFDAEELVYEERRDPFFLGSTHFARTYVADKDGPTYRAGILVDMIGDADLQLYYEQNSYQYARGLVEQVWGIAKSLNIKEFQPSIIHLVRDDHLPLNEIAKIPTIDLIDFDYPRGVPKNKTYWHTTADTPDKCSGESLVKVGKVLLHWVMLQK